MKNLRVLFFTICAALAANALFAQSSISMPTISEPTMPSMSSFPTISASTTGEGQGGQAQQSQSGESAKSAGSTSSSLSQTISSYATASSLAGLSASILGGDSNQSALLNSLLGTGNTLTQNGTGFATNVLLEQILRKIEEMIEMGDDEQSPAPAQTEPAAAGAKIIRFSVNGYNMLETFRNVYSSGKSENGNFLLTGERKYLSDGATYSETFYILAQKLSPRNYEIAVSVIQDYANEYSFMYQLEQRSPIAAQATGNLFIATINEPNFKLDLLIDIADLR